MRNKLSQFLGAVATIGLVLMSVAWLAGVDLSAPMTLALSLGLGSCAFGVVMDKSTEFCDATSVAAAAGTALLGNQIPLSVARNLGAGGRTVYLVISVATEIITAGAAGTIKFQLVSDAAAAIATDGTASIHWDSGTFVTDDAAANSPLLNAGSILAVVPLPGEGRAYEAYLGILAVIATTEVTAGAIDAYLTLDPPQWKALDNNLAAV